MASPEFCLNGEVVVLTGGAGILGQRLTLALATCGARVAVLDKDRGRLSEMTSRHGEGIRSYVCDLCQPHELRAVASRIEYELGTATALVNAAATKSEHFFAPVETFPLEDWEAVMNVNVTAAMVACQVFGKSMAQRGRGGIVNILSIYGVVAPDQSIYEGSRYEGHSINTPAVYSTSKAALWGLTRYLATYWASRGVRVNAITPGGVFSGQNDTFVSRYSARVPLGRMAHEDEMSGALVYLLSPAAAYVTGQNIIVDGGLSVW
jgi:NAD(P)-dependent dehydrogenase (short-subunit alcohol dehydrogenase family)